MDKPHFVVGHVTWGPGAEKLSEPERAAAISRVIAAADAHRADTVEIPRADLMVIYEALLRLARLGQTSLADFEGQSKEVSEIKHAIFAQTEFRTSLAGQALSRADQDAVRQRVKDAVGE